MAPSQQQELQQQQQRRRIQQEEQKQPKRRMFSSSTQTTLSSSIPFQMRLLLLTVLVLWGSWSATMTMMVVDAQPAYHDGGNDGGGGDDYYNDQVGGGGYNTGYGGNNNDPQQSLYEQEYAQDNLYQDYAARLEQKAVGGKSTAVAGGGLMTGWFPLVGSVATGWVLGGHFHARRMRHKLNAKFKQDQKQLYQQYYNDVYTLQQQNAELMAALEQYANVGGTRRS